MYTHHVTYDILFLLKKMCTTPIYNDETLGKFNVLSSPNFTRYA